MNADRLIYVADDETHIRSMIQMFLENEGFQVETFSDGYALSDAMKRKQPDMIILDIMMPGEDGLSLCEQIRKTSHVPIIFVSAKSTSEERITGLEKGGDDYIIKPFIPLELIARVHALFRREKFSVPQIKSVDQFQELSCGNMVISPISRKIMIDNMEFPVTPGEFDFLLYLCQRKETAVEKKEVLQKIWEFCDEQVDSRVSDDLLKRLRKKLQASHAALRIETVWGYGYRMTELEL